MELLFVRHGKAVEVRTAGRDEWRWLTPRGRGDVRSLGSWLVERGFAPTRILTSPLVRAVQTAELLASSLAFETTVDVADVLGPGRSSSGPWEMLSKFEPKDAVICVGHHPDLSTMCASMLGLPGFPPLRVGAACLLRVVDTSASFRWVWNPGSQGIIETLDTVLP